MAAGLGFKTFTTGEVLTAADTNGYLMQGILVFASAAARDAAITSPQEGQFAYLKDTNVTTYYTGSAWANVDTTGMTNPMTTTGDMIYSSSGSTPARLGIGSTGNVLTVAGGVPSWAAPAGGGKVLQVVQGTTSTSTTVASATYTDTSLTASITPSAATSKILVLVTQAADYERSGSDNGLAVRIMRGATAIMNDSLSYSTAYASAFSSSMFMTTYVAYNYLDSPNTTSATTYKTQGRSHLVTSGGQCGFQEGGALSTITLLEIGA